jgi:hypothetical protein
VDEEPKNIAKHITFHVKTGTASRFQIGTTTLNKNEVKTTTSVITAIKTNIRCINDGTT